MVAIKSTITAVLLNALLSSASALHHRRHYHAFYPRSENGTDVAGPTGQSPTGTGSGVVSSTVTTTIHGTITSTLPPGSEPTPDSGEKGNGNGNGNGNPIVPKPSDGNGDGTCDPATTTVTKKERVTITITPGAETSKAAVTTTNRLTMTVVPSSAETPASTEEAPKDKPAKTPAGETPKAEETTKKEAPKETPKEEAPKETPKEEAPKKETPKEEAPKEEQIKPESVPSQPSKPAPEPTPTTLPRSNSGSKRGVVYNDPKFANVFKGKGTWAYNWDQIPNELNGVPTSEKLDSSFEFVPMLWGDLPVHIDRWDKNIEKSLAAGATHILGFNEPDLGEQAGIPVERAAALYKQHISKYADKARLGTPGVTNGADGMGIDYLEKFLQQCKDCGIKFAAIHWYEEAFQVEYFKKHVQEAHDRTGLPIWITEFGARGSDQDISKFLEQVIPWLEKTDYVERYSYFKADEILANGDQATPIGAAYVA